jgi:hypothetical protein
MNHILRRDVQLLWLASTRCHHTKKARAEAPARSFSLPHSLTRSIYLDVWCGDPGSVLLFIELALDGGIPNPLPIQSTKPLPL